MPKKVDYLEELKSLKGMPDSTLRSVTTRVSVECLRKLYRLCSRDAIDLSTLVRQILEAQADLYLAAGALAIPSQTSGGKTMLLGMLTGVMLQLPSEIRELADKACEGLAVDLPTLLQLVVTDAMPAWIMRASKARQQRRQALEAIEDQLSPERAVWETYCRLAAAKYRSHLSRIRELIEEGLVSLELNGDAILFLVLDYETAVELDENTADHPGIEALQALTNAEVLIPEQRHEGSGSKWRLVPNALVHKTGART